MPLIRNGTTNSPLWHTPIARLLAATYTLGTAVSCILVRLNLKVMSIIKTEHAQKALGFGLVSLRERTLRLVCPGILQNSKECLDYKKVQKHPALDLSVEGRRVGGDQ